MSQPINFRRGTNSDRSITTLGAGEPGWSTDTKELFVGDGITVGGIKVGGAPETTDFTIYVASTTYGGSTGGVGRKISNGSATSTVANKLVDSAASFTSAKYLNKTVYNSTTKAYAKITAVDSSTQLSLSANIMSIGDAYIACDAVTTLHLAWDKVPSPFYANITIQLSPETHTGTAELVGRIPAGSYALTITPVSATTTFSGTLTVRQRVSIGSSLATLLLSGKIYTYGGADINWTSCQNSGAGKIFIYAGAYNTFTNCTGGITIGNNPTNIVTINSTITKGYTYYVASSTFGGSDATGDGLQMYSGSATSTTANKLVDSAANFGSDAANKTIYNSTDDTWAKVTAVDSPTQLSLSADIMASGESYVISSAFATVQKAVDMVPSIIDCNTVIKMSGETFSENVIVMGKSFSGAYYLSLKGTLTNTVSLRNVTAATYKTVTVDGAALTASAHIGQVLDIVAGPGIGQKGVVLDNTTTVLTIVGSWYGSSSGVLSGSVAAGTTPTTASDVKVGSIATTINSIRVTKGQKGVVFENINNSTGAFKCDTQSAAEIFGCALNGVTSGRYIWCLDQSNLDVISSNGPVTTTGTLTQYVTGCTGNIYNSWFKHRVAPSLNSMVVFRSSKVSNLAANNDGLAIEGDSVCALAFDQNTENSFTGASGAGYDVHTTNKSLARGMSSAYNVYGTKSTDASSTET